MKIGRMIREIGGGWNMEVLSGGHFLYRIRDKDITWLDNRYSWNRYLFWTQSTQEEIFLTEGNQVFLVSSEGILKEIFELLEEHTAIGYGSNWIIVKDYLSERGTYLYTQFRGGKKQWSIELEPFSMDFWQDYGLCWGTRLLSNSRFYLVNLATGDVLWSKDRSDSYIDLVIPYSDRVVIQWARKTGTKATDWIACFSLSSGELLWESSVSGNYQKYGEDKLVSFWSHYWKEDATEENHQYAEIDVHTGEVYTRKFSGYNQNVYIFIVYKDYLVFASRSTFLGLGIIDLRSRELIQEVEVEFTPGDFNQIKSLGVYKGELYVEVQTEVYHSDIHVFALEE